MKWILFAFMSSIAPEIQVNIDVRVHWKIVQFSILKKTFDIVAIIANGCLLANANMFTLSAMWHTFPFSLTPHTILIFSWSLEKTSLFFTWNEKGNSYQQHPGNRFDFSLGQCSSANGRIENENYYEWNKFSIIHLVCSRLKEWVNNLHCAKQWSLDSVLLFASNSVGQFWHLKLSAHRGFFFSFVYTHSDQQ